MKRLKPFREPVPTSWGTSSHKLNQFGNHFIPGICRRGHKCTRCMHSRSPNDTPDPKGLGDISRRYGSCGNFRRYSQKIFHTLSRHPHHVCQRRLLQRRRGGAQHRPWAHHGHPHYPPTSETYSPYRNKAVETGLGGSLVLKRRALSRSSTRIRLQVRFRRLVVSRLQEASLCAKMVRTSAQLLLRRARPGQLAHSPPTQLATGSKPSQPLLSLP
mmetsp:Transcript_5013/g.7718  ORF Transcript_5013/g.7718 Transcript_5013/m.7718 type:complete len:215 (-) Transcript_5013:71-715(-)